jgi:putative restriction endonuclease
MDVLAQFAALRVWRRGGERAPHKPLLVLWALGRVARGESRLAPYAEVDRALERLLREFGPLRRSVHPELPFWHLQTDGLWEIPGAEHLRVRAGSSNPPRGELLARGAVGGFTPEVEAALRADPVLMSAVAHAVLDAHFPASVHEDLLAAVGLDEVPAAVSTATRRRRDPQFRLRVLTAYERRCAVCGFDVRLGDVALGLDAAHIRWHQAGGPDTVENGLALCVLHHKLFDRGAFTLTDTHRVELSEQLHGGVGFAAQLLDFHGRPIREPQTLAYLPAPEFLHWHRREVFQGPARP